jgi:hypothetical protein
VPEPEGQPELIVYPPERIDDSGELLPGTAAGGPTLRTWVKGLPPRRRNRWLTAAVVAVLVLAVGMFSHRHPHRNSAAPAPDAFASAPEQQALGLRGRRVSLGDGTPIDLAMQGALVYVLTRSPPRLIEVDGRGRTVMNSIMVTEGTTLMAFDGESNRLVTVSSDGVSSMLQFYEPLLFNVVGQLALPIVVNAITSVGGQLWLGANGGLYRITTRAKVAERLSGVDGAVRALVADPARHRLLVTLGDWPTTLLSVDSATGRVTARSTLALGKVSLAVAAATIWVGGYGGPNDRKVLRLSPSTLNVIGASPVDAVVGPGAIVWGGEDVVWVRSGDSEDLACLASGSGSVLAHWSGIQGPVVSGAGLAFAPSMGYLLMLQTLHTSCQVG